MADWSEILKELQATNFDYDACCKKYLNELSVYTGRNLIIYYSGWLQKSGAPTPLLVINDLDKNAFMTTIKGLDRTKGLDLVLHTPGGDTAATESIIDYLCTMFSDIRVIVPQLAMSAGTMIACSADSILMGKHSSLGPIDPQYPIQINGSTFFVPAHGLIEEFKTASEQIKDDASKAYVWQPILQKYNPTILGEAQKAIDWSSKIISERLNTRMLKNKTTAERKKVIKKILKELGDHSVNLSHSRHLSYDKCKEIGLVVDLLESNQDLQEKVLSVHHALMHTLGATLAAKITMNHDGIMYVQQIPIIQQNPKP